MRRSLLLLLLSMLFVPACAPGAPAAPAVPSPAARDRSSRAASSIRSAASRTVAAATPDVLCYEYQGARLPSMRCDACGLVFLARQPTREGFDRWSATLSGLVIATTNAFLRFASLTAKQTSRGISWNPIARSTSRLLIAAISLKTVGPPG